MPSALSSVQLGLYNRALLLLGERRLTATENREPRAVLDLIWDTGAIKTCLEQGQWKFATRVMRLEYEPSIEPDFGFNRAFVKPDDCVRTTAVAADEFFLCPLDSTQYDDTDGRHWYASFDTLYVKFVSNDASYGNDTSLWPETFKRYLESYLAFEGCEQITNSADKVGRMAKIMKARLIDARSKDAMAGGTGIVPEGSWNTSRRGIIGRTRASGTIY